MAVTRCHWSASMITRVKTCSYGCTGACSLLIVVALRVSRSASRRSCHSPRLTNSTARATTNTTSSAHRTHSRRTSPRLGALAPGRRPSSPPHLDAAALVRASAVTFAAAPPRESPRPTATPTRKAVSGAASRSTSCAESRARSSRVWMLLLSSSTSVMPSSSETASSQVLSSATVLTPSSSWVRLVGCSHGASDAAAAGGAGRGRPRPGPAVDTVAVEEPLEVRLDGRPFQVTMRTPGDDIDLVHGLLHSEQVITEAAQVRAGALLRRQRSGRGEHLQRRRRHAR